MGFVVEAVCGQVVYGESLFSTELCHESKTFLKNSPLKIKLNFKK